MELYNIVRFYERGGRRIIRRGLTLDEAKKHCSDEETSSYTAKSPKGCGNNTEKIARWHEAKKHWFDGFERA